MRSSQGRLVWILLAAVGLLLVAAVVSVVVYLLLRPQPLTTGWQDPVSAIVPDQVASDLALYPLAGASEVETVDAAVASGDLETAYATLVFGLEMSDAQRIGRLILLGGRFAEAEEPDRAVICYQQVYDVAVLSPSLNDPARADALLASGKGWAALEQEDRALEAYDQAYLIAVQSPYLQMANRRDLLTALEAAYGDLGVEERAATSRTEIVELDQETSPHPPVIPEEVPDLSVGEAVISSPEVGNLEELEGTTQPSKRIGVNSQLSQWLMLKYKIAARGFGLSPVPEWEAQLADIQSSLSKAHEGLFFDYEDLVTALPDASMIGLSSYQVRRQVILDGRLGRYPNDPAEQLADKLQDAAQGLIASGAVELLYVDVGVRDGQLFYFLSPADEYGQTR
ncbi:MAG: hypothetical protein P8189_15885 [Anaerolineae bacterium]